LAQILRKETKGAMCWMNNGRYLRQDAKLPAKRAECRPEAEIPLY